VYLHDKNKTNFENDSFDLGILSHVLEHVQNPTILLREALRICKYVVVEVPLEDCLSVNIYSKFGEKIKGLDRENNPVGHINFFNKAKVTELVSKSGGGALKERNYRSWKIFFNHSNSVTLLNYLKSVTFYMIFKITGSRIVESHYAVLIRKRK
jgi:ubiquinone/menaquinone biosynthesis C-methylase UbiE